MILTGKTALITGASRGIGKGVAKCFASEGAKLVLTARSEDALTALKDELTGDGAEIITFAGDITKQEDLERLKRAAESAFGKVDILINNAGVSIEKPFLEISIEEWEFIHNVNLTGTMLVTRTFLPAMLEAGSGNIVNVASAAGLRGLPGSTAYSSSKAAVLGFTHALADEYKKSGVRINAICTGPVRTEMFEESAVRDFILASGGDLFEVEEAASAILFLASEQSSKMNSQVLTLRGYNRW